MVDTDKGTVVEISKQYYDANQLEGAHNGYLALVKDLLSILPPSVVRREGFVDAVIGLFDSDDNFTLKTASENRCVGKPFVCDLRGEKALDRLLWEEREPRNVRDFINAKVKLEQLFDVMMRIDDNQDPQAKRLNEDAPELAELAAVAYVKLEGQLETYAKKNPSALEAYENFMAGDKAAVTTQPNQPNTTDGKTAALSNPRRNESYSTTQQTKPTRTVPPYIPPPSGTRPPRTVPMYTPPAAAPPSQAETRPQRTIPMSPPVPESLSPPPLRSETRPPRTIPMYVPPSSPPSEKPPPPARRATYSPPPSIRTNDRVPMYIPASAAREDPPSRMMPKYVPVEPSHSLPRRSIPIDTPPSSLSPRTVPAYVPPSSTHTIPATVPQGEAYHNLHLRDPVPRWATMPQPERSYTRVSSTLRGHPTPPPAPAHVSPAMYPPQRPVQDPNCWNRGPPLRYPYDPESSRSLLSSSSNLPSQATVSPYAPPPAVIPEPKREETVAEMMAAIQAKCSEPVQLKIAPINSQEEYLYVQRALEGLTIRNAHPSAIATADRRPYSSPGGSGIGGYVGVPWGYGYDFGNPPTSGHHSTGYVRHDVAPPHAGLPTRKDGNLDLRFSVNKPYKPSS